MVQTLINLNEANDRILNIVKAQNRLKNKTQAVEFIIETYAEAMEEPKLRPEFIREMSRIKKEKGIPFKNIEELRNIIEN